MGIRPPTAFYARSSLDLAPDLIGLNLVRNDAGTLRVGRIVETEAYMGPEDLAAHSAGGRRTARTEVMFGPPGRAYVYFIYGFWNCLNVVASPAGVPHAVLLRALEPVAGVDDATWGPGLLCRALHVDRTLNGADLRGKELWIERPRKARAVRIGTSPRIGVAYAGAWARRPWRFFDRDSPYLSTVSAAARRRAAVPAR
jgi:DNA-3-methyladenine glycosylase